MKCKIIKQCKAGLWAFFLFLLINSGYSQETTVSFENAVPESHPGPNLYGNLGVLFPAGALILSNQSIAHSGKNVLVSNDITNEFDQAPLTIIFTIDVTSVKLFTGIPWETGGRPVRIVMSAYDGQENLLTDKTLDVTGPTKISTELQLRAQPGKFIRKIVLNAGNHFEYIDDLTFTSAGNALPPPAAKPVIHISNPTPNSNTEDGNVMIKGTIEGYGFYPEINRPELNISYSVNPGSQEPAAINTYINVTAVNSTRYQFNQPWKLANLGLNTITIKATSTGGDGYARLAITFMPSSILNKFHESGGLNTFGNFAWGISEGSYLFAVYEKGAIFSAANGTYAVTGPIFTKWKSLISSTKRAGLLGCATGNRKFAPGYESQDFTGGRIYSSSLGTYYITEPFLSAADKLNFVTDFGPPASDPAKQYDPMLPKIWQVFSKRFNNDVRISTMELTDNPWTLWTASPDINGARLAGTNVSPRTPTVWRQYTCNSSDGPCSIIPTTPSPRIDPVILLNSCGSIRDFSRVYPWCNSCNQWEPVYEKTITPLLGIVKESRLSGTDNPFNHQCNNSGGERGWIWYGLPADWCTYVIPDSKYEQLIRASDKDIEVEYEWCITGFPLSENNSTDPAKAKLTPQPGDKIFFAGRYIADCAHNSAKPEIHPPSIMLNMYSEGSKTRGDIVYFPWWYPSQAVEVDIYPPPRPSPDAYLKATVPMGGGLSTIPFEGLNWKDNTLGTEGKYFPAASPNHLTLRLTGISGAANPPVERNGMLFHAPATIGIILLYWEKR